VGEDGRACAARDLLELLLPAAGIGIGDVHFSDHAVEDQIEEPVLGADVPVQRGGGDVQGARDVAHAQQVESVLVEHRECRIDDRLLGEQVASAPRRSLGRSRPRRRGQVGPARGSAFRHVNTVQVLNTLLICDGD